MCVCCICLCRSVCVYDIRYDPHLPACFFIMERTLCHLLIYEKHYTNKMLID